ncbi:MAG: EcsC family protein [Candidatus Xenobiia bacterium LiM19]
MPIDIIPILQEFFETIDKKDIINRVEELQCSYPGISREELCKTIINDEAFFCGIVGTGAYILPGPFSLAMCAPDIINLLSKQSRVVLSVAYIFGFNPSSPERIIEILACLGFTSCVISGNDQVKQMIIAGLKSGFVKEIARNIGIVLSKKMINSIIPFISSVTGGISNYIAVLSVGRAAISYYSSEN